MWRGVASKQQLSDIPEIPSAGLHGWRANQTPAHAMVCGRKSCSPVRLVSLQRGLAWNFSPYTIKHPGMKVNQTPSSPHSLQCLSAIARKAPLANRKSAGKNNGDAQQFLLLQDLLCLSHLTSKKHQALAVCFMIILFRKTVGFFLFYFWGFFNWTEMRSIFLWWVAVSQPWLWVIRSQSLLEKKKWEQTAEKWKWYLVSQSLFWEGIFVTSNQSGSPAWKSHLILEDFCGSWWSCRWVSTNSTVFSLAIEAALVVNWGRKPTQ